MYYCVTHDLLLHRRSVVLVSSTSRRSDSYIPVSHTTEQKHTNSNLSLASIYNVHANSKDSKDSKTKRVILQTTDVTASGCTGKSGISTVLFDTGSDRSYVSSRLVKRVGPTFIRDRSGKSGDYHRTGRGGTKCLLCGDACIVLVGQYE